MSDKSKAFEIIKKFEGCKLKAYQDSVGVWTLAYGHTLGVHAGMTCTQEQADQWLQEEVNKCWEQVSHLVVIPINDNQHSALTSFVYNLGQGALAKSTLLRLLNTRHAIEDVAFEFLKWDMAGGKVLPGLLRRRKAERALFLS